VVQSYKLFGPNAPLGKCPTLPFHDGPLMPACIFCGETQPTKIYMEGAIVKDGRFVWRFKGVVHHACAEAEMEARR
jgi:hypothetical protein